MYIWKKSDASYWKGKTTDLFINRDQNSVWSLKAYFDGSIYPLIQEIKYNLKLKTPQLHDEITQSKINFFAFRITAKLNYIYQNPYIFINFDQAKLKWK